MTSSTDFKLTQFSHGAGCGCKIAPEALERILEASIEPSAPPFPRLLVGHETRDDAAAYDWGDGTALVSTTDFFMPIVDDAEDFGYIAAVNAINDIYAMGATPLMAIALLGWPVNFIPVEVAGQVVLGARRACSAAGIPLAGGHSVDSPEPLFGLAVSGRVPIEHLKRNSGATPGARLYLTKPLGVGILTTAQKYGMLRPEHGSIAVENMKILNRVGVRFGQLPYVQAMTDVTGFGLLGHLIEMCQAAGVGAIVHADQVPLLDEEVLDIYLQNRCVPAATQRNWDGYGQHVAGADERLRALFADPQTAGGLLVAVAAGHEADFEREAAGEGLTLKPFGFCIELQAPIITLV
jgi:selenide,water dikinase